LAAIVLQLIKFINDAADPRAIFTDLQEIAHGEGGLVYAAHTVPAIVRQFGPMTLRSPARRLSQDVAAPVAIKRVMIPRGGSPKLVDLQCELELAHSLCHAN
ncbi:hypothetical protein V8E53_002347, partial [Lactarius tabidus]